MPDMGSIVGHEVREVTGMGVSLVGDCKNVGFYLVWCEKP